MKRSASRIICAAVAAAAATTLLSSCASVVPMEPAADANTPACANVIVRLPDKVAGLDKRETNAQSTGAWGDGGPVQLVCGEEPTGPTTDQCVSVNGVDWVINDSAAPVYRFEAYGRTPGLAVYVDSETVSGTDAVLDLSAVARQLPQTRKCTAVSDTLELE
ncbi:DUF3515 family protein [Leucobacter sp. HY1908]